MSARLRIPETATVLRNACLPVQELKFHKEAMKKLGKKRKVPHHLPRDLKDSLS